ncbi:lipoate-protein ligase B (plasmid) [Azospirillum sp. TSH58]|uniref:lipoyl(octanoyl) transferase LipB n=1 Tax=Azospirillum sp. TSH58 TaxID=664962 RepID=UPI000D6021FD|nr:lipoyl(octanoyl) transferase LipB [Azospirillum sp. TSH58]AWJ85608.1 lipoate-protein ligase B [Azospirillum sp. TSH58]PWC61823.1 lipoate--protein ligase [Azospirillum sp. TSH58]
MTDLTAPLPPSADAIGDAVPAAAAAPARAVEWRISDTPVPYPDALAEMEARVEAIRAGTAPELVWLLEHPPLYTAGTSAREEDLLEPGRFPVYQAGRGGQFTYHGPGQRVAYVMLDLKTRGADIRAFVQDLEEWLIRTLAAFNIRGERREGRVGIWVDKGPYGGAPGQEDKIAAIGVRVRRWVSFHGVALNVEPDLSHFAGIVPCGISEHGVTSIVALGHLVAMEDVDAALMASFAEVFGGAVGGGGPEEE